jgi:hypothetical protein
MNFWVGFVVGLLTGVLVPLVNYRKNLNMSESRPAIRQKAPFAVKCGCGGQVINGYIYPHADNCKGWFWDDPIGKVN